MQAKISSASNRAAPRMEPTTMPATWPPVRPLLRLDAAVGLEVDEEVGEGVEDVKSGCMLDVATTGSTTPLHLASVPEKTQQESVESVSYTHLTLPTIYSV